MAEICITGALARAIGKMARPDESVTISWPPPGVPLDAADEEVWGVRFGGEPSDSERSLLINDQTGAWVDA